MSVGKKKNPIIFMFSAKDRVWSDSTESIQRASSKPAKSETSVKMEQVNFLLLQSEALARLQTPRQLLDHRLKPDDEEEEESVLWVHPKSSNSGEIGVLRVTMSRPESRIYLAESEEFVRSESEVLMQTWDIVDVIDASEDAPKDKLPWKYLRRCRVYEKQKGRLIITWLRAIHYHYSKLLGRRRAVTSCPNCTFSVRTITKHVSSVRTRRTACTLTVVGLCGLPYMSLMFKDVVHVCPFCNVYLGFCPAFKHPKKSEPEIGGMGDGGEGAGSGVEGPSRRSGKRLKAKSKF